MWRRSVCVAVLTTMLAVVSPGVAGAQPGAVPVAPIDWSECSGAFQGECATIPVPVDWAAPGGPQFRLAIGRLTALDPAHRIGVLLAHPGGPGLSGINTFIVGRRIPDTSPLRQFFDIVSLDPRGVARSNPVVCSTGLVDSTPMTFPASQVDYDNLREFNDKLARNCREQTGPVFDHVDSVSVAKDVDAIRAALGQRQITFFGASYGTQVGQHYAELYPGRIRAMALDSNLDHSITSAVQFMTDSTGDQEATYLEFAAWCGRTAACALHGRDAVAVWDALHARAEAGRLIDPDTGEPVGAEQLRLEMNDLSFRPKDHWLPLASRLAALADAPTAGAPAEVVAQETVENPQWAIWCSDWRWDVGSFAELDRIRRQLAETVAPHTKLSPFWSDVTSCLGWSGPLNNPQHRLAISGTPTILLTRSRHDVSTPTAWTGAVAAQIGNSVLVEYDGVGHGNYRISTCARKTIETYLITRTPPPAGTHCPAEYPS